MSNAMTRRNVTKCYVDSTLTQANKKTCQGYRDETLNGTSFNVMTMVEGLILQENCVMVLVCPTIFTEVVFCTW